MSRCQKTMNVFSIYKISSSLYQHFLRKNEMMQSRYTKLGVYVDVANMYHNGGQRMQYGVLREFACRDYAEAIRLNAYVSYDVERAKWDIEYRMRVDNFHSVLRDLGYKVIVKEVRWYRDESGERYGKANADLDLAVDALLQSEKLDRVLIASGDGDFGRVILALQNRGVRVEVLALENSSFKLREEADLFIHGHLVPNLIPTRSFKSEEPVEWGKVGSRVRGWCYWHSEQGYGFIRYLTKIASGLWLTDTRDEDSPYGTAFFHDSNLPDGVKATHLPNRNCIFEFTLSPSERGNGVQAIEMEKIQI